MMKSIFSTSKWRCMTAAAFLFSAAMTGSFAQADPIPTTAFSESYTGNGSSTEAVVRVYDNWTNPPSLLTSLFAAGTDEIADDLTTVGGGGILSSMGINVANANNTASNYTGGSLNVRFYDLVGGAFINGFVANTPVLNLAAGGSSRLSFAAGSLTALGINIPATGVFVSLQHVTATFAGAGSIANIGFQTRAPIGVGSSTDNLLNVTTAAAFNFGGNPLANTGIFLDVDVVPEPTSLGLLVTGIVTLLARRRS